MCDSSEASIEEDSYFDVLEKFKQALENEERRDAFFRTKSTFFEEFNNKISINPHGLTSHDSTALGDTEFNNLQLFKKGVRKSNYEYLESHPKVEALISLFLKKLLERKPKNVVEFAAKFFTVQGTDINSFKSLIDQEESKLKHKKIRRFNLLKKDLEVFVPKTNLDEEKFRKLHIEPLAIETMEAKVVVPECTKRPKTKEPKKKPYCGCKDLKAQLKRKAKKAAKEKGGIISKSTKEMNQVDTDSPVINPFTDSRDQYKEGGTISPIFRQPTDE